MLGIASSPYDIHFPMSSSNGMGYGNETGSFQAMEWGYGNETGNLVACRGINDFVQVSQYGKP